jgi:hypothetical protein
MHEGLVEFERVQTWKIYRIVFPCPPKLEVNLKTLVECAKFDLTFKQDLIRLKEILNQARCSACVRIPPARRLHRPSAIHAL